MFKLLQSEWLKQKHSFNKIILWLGPGITILLALVLMGGRQLQNGAYNWWYFTILPGCFTMFCAFTVSNEQKKNRHGLFGIVVQKNKLWLAQIMLLTLFLLATCMIFFVCVTFGGMVFGQEINAASSFFASCILFITFAWQIPLWMFVTEKVGVFITILISLVCNIGTTVICSTKSFWWIPFSIPARLMSPIIGVLPNGLGVEVGSEMADSAVVLPGVLIAVVLFIVLTTATMVWFNKHEV